MTSEQLSTIIVSAAGYPGQDGTRSWDGSNNYEAPFATPGRHGRHALAPTHGSYALDVAVHVRSSPDCSVLVEPVNSGSGQQFWAVSPAQDMFIDCRGGNGGHGGIGENGQPGGEGEKGVDATRYSNATSGHQGYRGGDAGLGTDGADGGNGGHVYMTVQETDMDTLLALRWNVQGGAGGESGIHGARGRGGPGGRGGAGCEWTESHSRSWVDSNGHTQTEYYTTYHSRPTGHQGPDGPPGRECTQPLSAGRSGADGYCQIKLLRKDGGDEVYSGRYQLVVQSFDVVDENEDGINEPGEYLIVRNILVQNIGTMPSPRYNPLHIHIRPTPWLEPDMTQLLELPPDIPPGATVGVPGVLRALIKNEYGQRPAGISFRAEDTVSLVAFSQRLTRRVPEFSGSQLVVYQYPVTMSRPKFLDAVAIGDRVKFSWMIRNISSKPYGSAAAPRRQIWSCISDPGGTFDLVSAGWQESSSPQSVTYSIDQLEPGNDICVSQYLTVSSTAAPFSVGQMSVRLFLSDPHDEDPSLSHSVVHFDLAIQVSPPYRYNPRANFLVVISCAVQSQTILQLMNFIEQGLHLQADIFNLSLVGSFTAPGESSVSLFSRYVSKTIVIFSNSIVYFQNGIRVPWDLIDPWEMCRLATAGTSFLLVYPSDMDRLRKWAWQLALPAYAFPPPLEESLVKKPKKVLAQLMGRYGLEDGPLPSLVVKKGIFRSLDSTALSKAESLQRQLDRQFPLRRFLVSPVEDQSSPTRRAVVAMSEGLPYQTKIVALLPLQDTAAPAAASLLNAMVVHSIPYVDQCRIFWNIFGAGQAAGMSIHKAYGGDSLMHFLDGDHAMKGEDKRTVNPKALETISWSIAQQIASEMSSFCRKAPWPDRATNTNLSQLPILETFIKTAPPSIHPVSEEGISLLNTIFPPALGLSAPLSVGQWLSQKVVRLGSRKRKVRKLLHRELDQLLQTLYGPDSEDAGKTAAKNITQKLSSEVKQSLAQIKRDNPDFGVADRAHEYCCRCLAEITLVPKGSRVFVDLGDLSGVERSVTMSPQELEEKRRLYEVHVAGMERDKAWSEQMLADMVSHLEAGPEEFPGEAEMKYSKVG